VILFLRDFVLRANLVHPSHQPYAPFSSKAYCRFSTFRKRTLKRTDGIQRSNADNFTSCKKKKKREDHTSLMRIRELHAKMTAMSKASNEKTTWKMDGN
jgi:hypothetical protein